MFGWDLITLLQFSQTDSLTFPAVWFTALLYKRYTLSSHFNGYKTNGDSYFETKVRKKERKKKRKKEVRKKERRKERKKERKTERKKRITEKKNERKKGENIGGLGPSAKSRVPNGKKRKRQTHFISNLLK